MVFSSVLFLFRFLPIFFICYFMAPKRMRNLVLFFGSLIFYAWGEPVYVVLMLFSTLSDYIHGLLIARYREKPAAKYLLVSSVVINLGLLGFFKYSGLNLPLPIGISFYTFQTMSYTIDVYRGEVEAQKNLLDFGVFVTMFPQLIAGPIVKYSTVAKELKERHATLEDMAAGAKRFTIGLGKKVLLANNVGQLFTEISGMAAGELTASMAWMGILAYAFQIYFDFSGYSDMAIGLGRIMGFHFPENFNYPYTAVSITDFWRRWHMSLSSWFREYVYIPLGGNRKGLNRQLINILIVWSLTGIWHGAGWNFLFWGMWFAVFLILEKVFLGKLLAKIPKLFGWLYAMMVVLISWCFFSLEQTDKIVLFLKAMFGFGEAGLYSNRTLYLFSNYGILFLLLAAGAVPLLKRLVEWLQKKCSNGQQKKLKPARIFYMLFENVFLIAVLILSIANIVDASYNPFLYFRF
ncbi:MAG: MBOAT family O-acyltransferase [Lachnospiraceae bacterium]|nr:MBOAT family O-acyltransferase [Lachnospiraceae bacterium]